jgi:hypothetical protein
MKNKTKLLAVAILCGVCVGLLPAIVSPSPYRGLHLLWLGYARAASCPYSSCGDCISNNPGNPKLWCVAIYGCCSGCDYCLWQSGGNLNYCVSTGYCPASESEAEPPPQPPDQVDTNQGRDGVYDPQEPDIWFDFPPEAVPVPIETRAYRTALPAGVPLPANGTVGAPFYFGAWIRGEGGTVSEFHQPIVIHVRHRQSDLPHLSAPVPEDRLGLRMYDPGALSWIKLCSQVDPDANVVSGALLAPTPLEGGGNALFAVVPDTMPPLEQVVDDQGNTTLFIPESNFKLGVLAGTVEVGTHFEITLLPEVPGSDLFKLLPTPVDIKACQSDNTRDCKVRQLTQFPKPMQVTFEVDADTLSRAGGRANLTILSLQDRQWVDLEEFGYRVTRDTTTLAVDTGDLGTFSMAVR